VTATQTRRVKTPWTDEVRGLWSGNAVAVLGRNLRVRFNGNVLSSPLPARAADIRIGLHRTLSSVTGDAVLSHDRYGGVAFSFP